jgi:hypothetical protein
VEGGQAGGQASGWEMVSVRLNNAARCDSRLSKTQGFGFGFRV